MMNKVWKVSWFLAGRGGALLAAVSSSLSESFQGLALWTEVTEQAVINGSSMLVWLITTQLFLKMFTPSVYQRKEPRLSQQEKQNLKKHAWNDERYCFKCGSPFSFSFYRYDDINEWLNNKEPNAFLWLLTDYLSADGLISCWVHVLYDSTAPVWDIPSGTSRLGIPVHAPRSHCFRSSTTSLLPICLLSVLSSVLFLCPLISLWGFFNAFPCPCVRVRLPSAVSLEESLPENNRLFFLLELNTLTKTFWGLRPNPD